MNYLNLSVWVYRGGDLCDIHVRSIPILMRKTAVALYDLVVIVLQVLLSDWKKEIIIFTSVWESTMTGNEGCDGVSFQTAADSESFRFL